MTGGALRIVDIASVRHAAAPRRQILTIGADIDIPAGNLDGRRRAAEAVVGLSLTIDGERNGHHARGQHPAQGLRYRATFSCSHWILRRWPPHATVALHCYDRTNCRLARQAVAGKSAG